MTTVLLNPFRFGVAGPVVSDLFNRADSAVSMGNADTGQAWANLLGTWGILSNRAYNAVGSADASAGIEAGATDVTVTATIVTRDAGSCVIARAQDTANYYLVLNASGGTNTILYKKVAGAYTQLGSTVTGGTEGDVIALKATGTAIKAYRNTIEIISVTDGALTTGTKAGLRADTAGAKFDTFSVTTP